MRQRPTLQTDRLVLRPFTQADAPAVQRLAGDKEIAATTFNVPHPYEDWMAEQWISTHQEKFERGQAVNFAIVLRAEDCLIGAVELTIEKQDHRAELGYWIGKPYWSKGYCTEAARAVVAYGFDVLGLNRIHACHFAGNVASARVLQKIGMVREGCLRQHVRKSDRYEDCVVYGILKSEYERRKEP